MSAISNVIAALRKAQGEYPNAEEMKEINQLVSGLHKDNDIKKANKNPIEEFIGTFDAISLDIVNDKSNEFKDIFTNILEKQYEKKKKRDIWEMSKWKHIAELENDDVGKFGETIIQEWCKNANIPSDINGIKTKELGGGVGDGIILGKTVEIKTARMGSGTSRSFQHELGECPWKADYMLFLDVSPDNIYVTIFPNYSEKFYKTSGENSHIKLKPYFPTRSICWRKRTGAFKFDTTVNINETNPHTFKWTKNKTLEDFRKYINNIIS